MAKISTATVQPNWKHGRWAKPFHDWYEKTLELIAECIISEFSVWTLDGWLTLTSVSHCVEVSCRDETCPFQSSSVAFGSCLASLYTSIKVPPKKYVLTSMSSKSFVCQTLQVQLFGFIKSSNPRSSHMDRVEALTTTPRGKFSEKCP